MSGRTLGHYQILEELGHGGMGVVCKARDTRLGRYVAIKLLPFQASNDAELRSRLLQEARSASALNHSGIVTIHSIETGDLDGRTVDFLVMEYIEGQTLDRRIAGRPLPVETALGWAHEMAAAVAAAHATGIVHRDLKPSNVIVGLNGRVKILDFGLAKLTQTSAEGGGGATRTDLTLPGTVLGTLAYMSPEQAQGEPADARSDIFSLGAMLYEMITGRALFHRGSAASTVAAVLRDDPPSISGAQGDLPHRLDDIMRRCLEKKAERRYASAIELERELAACMREVASAPAARRGSIVSAPIVAILIALLATLAGLGGFWTWRASRARWASEVALPLARELGDRSRTLAALRLLQRAERFIPGNPQLLQIEGGVSAIRDIRSTPSGAEVRIKDYAEPTQEWQLVGRTPILGERVPSGHLRWRVSAPGAKTLEAALSPQMDTDKEISFELEPAGAFPGMVRVPAGSVEIPFVGTVETDAFWIDTLEVTNRQYKAFVEAGGYRERRYWRHPFERDGRALDWESAMAVFRDATGRPGPATWELGTYPAPQADFPVGGVSWYEASAYAEFAGKSLPTVAHWYRAAAPGLYSAIVEFSNFRRKGPERVGASNAIGRYGTLDTAGNVKEWCANLDGAKRFALGGAWDEPPYMYMEGDSRLPLERGPEFGIRCAHYVAPPSASLLGPIERHFRDYSKEKPADDASFGLIRRLYDYDRTPLREHLDATNDGHPDWREERVSIDAAYGGERLPLVIYLPRHGAPPYQTVVWSPGGDAYETRSSADLAAFVAFFEFLPRTGRAVVFPLYQGTFERHVEIAGMNARRDRLVQTVKDYRRAVDYVETRKDLDAGRLAYAGLSSGANKAPLVLAIEPRFRAAVLLSGGFPNRPAGPEVDALNFAPRVRTPTLMINGRYDFDQSPEHAAQPMFRFLGTPEPDKRFVLLDSGHIPTDLRPIMREELDWLDRYLGPVKGP